MSQSTCHYCGAPATTGYPDIPASQACDNCWLLYQSGGSAADLAQVVREGNYTAEQVRRCLTYEMERRRPRRVLVSACLSHLRRARRASPLRSTVRSCIVCGCTDTDCRQCIAKTGQPCHWVAPDLCSACAPAAKGEPRP